MDQSLTVYFTPAASGCIQTNPNKPHQQVKPSRLQFNRKLKYNNDAKQIKQKPFVIFLPSLNPEPSCIVQEDITRLSIPVLGS